MREEHSCDIGKCCVWCDDTCDVIDPTGRHTNGMIWWSGTVLYDVGL